MHALLIVSPTFMLAPLKEASKNETEKIGESSVQSLWSDNESGLGFGLASLVCHNYDKLPLGVTLSTNTSI